ncbi:MAG TPA: hypothetical protein VHZ33_30965 [Trebonia sp.]|jgi:hypothetical protein|nr:hypothetical protein [Trebonia sp.]
MVQRWRCPTVLRVKTDVIAVIGAVVALVFLPLWFGAPVAVLLAAWAAGMTVFGSSVLINPQAGLLVFGMGLITRRVRLTDITAVLVDRSKVSVARSAGGEISLYAWRKSALDRWLRVPAEADDIGHAISAAVALAQDARDARRQSDGDPEAAQPPAVGSAARTRSRLATAWLGGAGLVAFCAALLVRVHWHNPVMTTLGVILALALGVCGLFYLLAAFWLLLTGRVPAHVAAPANAPAAADRASAV